MGVGLLCAKPQVDQDLPNVDYRMVHCNSVSFNPPSFPCRVNQKSNTKHENKNHHMLITLRSFIRIVFYRTSGLILKSQFSQRLLLVRTDQPRIDWLIAPYDMVRSISLSRVNQDNRFHRVNGINLRNTELYFSPYTLLS